MKSIVIILLLASSLHSYGRYYPGTLVFENGKSREGFIETNLGDVILFKGWMESQPEEIPSSGIKTVWIKTNGGHRMHEYHYLPVENSASGKWMRAIEKGAVSLYVLENISQQDGVDATEAVAFYSVRQGETKAKLIASHDNAQAAKSNEALFFADKHDLVEKIKSHEYAWANVSELLRMFDQRL